MQKDHTLKIEHIENDIEILTFFDLTEKEQIGIKDNYDSIEDSSFFRYRNDLYDLNDFMRIEKNLDLKNWDGYHSDSFFSGTLVKYDYSGDSLTVAIYFS